MNKKQKVILSIILIIIFTIVVASLSAQTKVTSICPDSDVKYYSNEKGDKIICIENPKTGSWREFEYDSLGNEIFETNHLDQWEKHTFHKNNNQASFTDYSGFEVYTDTLKNLIKIVVPSKFSITYEYENGESSKEYLWSSEDEIVSITFHEEEETYKIYYGWEGEKVSKQEAEKIWNLKENVHAYLINF